MGVGRGPGFGGRDDFHEFRVGRIKHERVKVGIHFYFLVHDFYVLCMTDHVCLDRKSRNCIALCYSIDSTTIYTHNVLRQNESLSFPGSHSLYL